MENKYTITGFVHILISILLGAFGAHALRDLLEASEMESFKSAVYYMQFHGLALLVLPLVQQQLNFKSHMGMRLLFWGILFFSYSILLLLLLKKNQLTYGFLIPITPLGGSLMIAGWFLLLWGFLKRKDV